LKSLRTEDFLHNFHIFSQIVPVLLKYADAGQIAELDVLVRFPERCNFRAQPIARSNQAKPSDR
jgi:hypothetical protein